MNPDIPLIVILGSGAVASAAPLLLWGLSGVGRRRGRPSGGNGEAEDRRVVDEHQLRLQQPALQRVFRPALQAVGRRVRKLTPASWVASLEQKVRLAGSPAAWPVERALALKLMMAITALLMGALWIVRFSPTGGGLPMTLARVALVPLLTLFAYMLPDLILRLRGKERQQAIQTALPDALDQMSISVEAGLGFDASLGRVVETGTGPLVEELQRTLQEIAIGIPRKQAFHNLVERTDVPELRHFVFAVNQAEEYGLPIAQVLRVQSKELRVIRRQRAEERAMKIPVKIVFPLILCIFPSLFVVLLVPAAIRIFDAIGK
jgi:tight adherence protein C